MSTASVPAFDTTLQTTFGWLHEIMERLPGTDRLTAYHHLRAVLHALRDRLSIDQAAALGSQLPILVRGIFYEGWQPQGKPLKLRHADEFLDLVARRLTCDDQEPEAVTRAVLEVVARHVSHGEVQHLKQTLPAAIRSLFPEEYHALWW